MAPGLARRHPGIKTYSGRGITDLSATIHADLTPLGFRASVRSANGNWYIDPYHVGRTPSVYASYFVRQVENTGHANNDTVVESAGLPVNVPEYPADRRSAAHLSPRADQRPGLLDVPRRPTERDRRQGRPDQPCQAHLRGRPDDSAAADREQRSPQPQHVRRGSRAERALRRSGLFHAVPGPRLPSTGRNRVVISQIIGASNYDLGHLGLGQPGGGVANLGVVGRGNKAGGCTGLPDSGRRLLRRRLRRPRDGPPVLGQPHVRRQPAQLLRR